jgi:hypothetical protein
LKPKMRADLVTLARREQARDLDVHGERALDAFR